MQKFTTLTSTFFSLPYKDIDTDMIIPAEYLKTTTKNGLGQYAFINMKKAYPDIPALGASQVLVAGQNFGCGSSREHAPWALLDAGIRVIISSKFADIFTLNSEKNGLLLIQLDEKDVQEIMNLEKNDVGNEYFYSLTVNLEKQTIIVGTGGKLVPSDAEYKKYHFNINISTKQKLLEGLDDLDYILKFKTEIEAFNHNCKTHENI